MSLTDDNKENVTHDKPALAAPLEKQLHYTHNSPKVCFCNLLGLHSTFVSNWNPSVNSRKKVDQNI